MRVSITSGYRQWLLKICCQTKVTRVWLYPQAISAWQVGRHWCKTFPNFFAGGITWYYGTPMCMYGLCASGLCALAHNIYNNSCRTEDTCNRAVHCNRLVEAPLNSASQMWTDLTSTFCFMSFFVWLVILLMRCLWHGMNVGYPSAATTLRFLSLLFYSWKRWKESL